jgi:NodT family efflux transporter outer membrane factor (OMF) lipoprotein
MEFPSIRTVIGLTRRWHLGVAIAAASVGGCAAPDLGPRPTPVSPATLASNRSLPLAAQTAQWPADRWWIRYGDVQLIGRIDEALAHSPSVAEAAARVRAARGVAEQAGGATLPQLSGSADGGGRKQSYNNGIPPAFVPQGWHGYGDISLGANFDLDLWGKNRASLAAATSDLTATQVDAQQARLILTTNLVSSYVDLARLYAEHDLLAEARTVRATSADLAQKRYAAGLDNRSSADLARAMLASAAAALEANDEQIAVRRNAIAALLGAGPDRGLAITRPDIAEFTPTPLPGDAGIALAGRRPDIVAARLRVEAQGHRIDAAQAAFLPDISLSGLFGVMSLGLDKLFDAGSTYGQAQAAISLPIFDGGARRGNYVATRGGYDDLVAQYDATVIEALHQVADAVASRASVERQSQQANAAYASSAAAYDIALRRYRGGLSNYIEALSAQSAMLDARLTAIDTRSRLVSLDISLVRALGGGFTDPTNTLTPRSALR